MKPNSLKVGIEAARLLVATAEAQGHTRRTIGTKTLCRSDSWKRVVAGLRQPTLVEFMSVCNFLDLDPQLVLGNAIRNVINDSANLQTASKEAGNWTGRSKERKAAREETRGADASQLGSS